MTVKQESGPILITFPPSLDSELGRLLLQHYAVHHTEQRHAFIFASLATLWHGYTVIFPLLYGESLRLTGPASIAGYYDKHCEPGLRLWPDSPESRAQVESDWTLFNNSLAFATAVFAYYHLLPNRELMVGPLAEGAPPFEQSAVRRAYPVFAGLLRLLLRLNPQHVEQSIALMRNIFSTVDTRLAGGRAYLVDDRLTLSDLAFAVAAAPAVLPSKYGGPMPPFDQMPREVQALVTEMRAHAAGAFALRIYQEHRERFGLSVAT